MGGVDAGVKMFKRTEIKTPIRIRPGKPHANEIKSLLLGSRLSKPRERLFFSRIRYHNRPKAGIVYVKILISSLIAENIITASAAGVEDSPGKKRTR